MGVFKNINRFAGSSVGALISGLLACKADAAWIKKEVFGLDFRNFKDDSWGVLQDAYRLYYNKGWHAGDALMQKYRELLKAVGADPDITFRGVYEKYGNELKVTTTLVCKKRGTLQLKLLFLSRHNYPDLEICKAVRMSAGFPFFFASVPFENTDAIDGGVLLNYPIKAFDLDGQPDPKVIGIRLLTQAEWYENNDSDKTNSFDISCDCECKCDTEKSDDCECEHECEHEYENECGDGSMLKQTANVKEFTEAIISGWYNHAQQLHENAEDWKRTIAVNTYDVSALDFNIDETTKHKLYQSGYNSAKKFVENNF